MIENQYKLLFEPIKLGPVKSKNRFYQVPHCTGMGRFRPNSLSTMRGIKAQGGWGVVCTEYCSIHPTSDDAPYPYTRLWDNNDIKAHALTTDKIHKYNALAGVELWIGGNYISNLDTRIPPIGIISRPITNENVYHPIQSRKLDKQDIKDIRLWHKNAAKKAVIAGFDIVYVYSTHGYLLSEFINSCTNNRIDEYGGSIKNRIRIVKELIEETLDAVSGKSAVATRFSIDINNEESFEAFELLKNLPDVWDLTVNDWGTEMGVSRFVKENSLEESVSKAKSLTKKPVVAVGRFTSPDTMISVIKKGIQDIIGAARPSIADPFLPNKILENRIDDIRECIGCNICYAHNTLGVPIRCTQNPTMGEEWRRSWHPEIINKSNPSARVLVIGSGPAGLEASRVLGERGYEVILAEKNKNVGGRINLESNLPGLSEWSRVRDWRIGQINKLNNVKVYLESDMNEENIFEVDVNHIILATGSRWTKDGIGRYNNFPIKYEDNALIISAEEILLKNNLPKGKVLIFDDDHYYMGSLLALELARNGNDVSIVTPAGRLGEWATLTEEIYQSNYEIIKSGVKIITNSNISKINVSDVEIECIFSGNKHTIANNWTTFITRREPNDILFYKIKEKKKKIKEIKSIQKIGDCNAPGIIASAVYSGYKVGVELGENNVITPLSYEL